MKGHCFNYVIEGKKKTRQKLAAIQTGKFERFQQWNYRLDQCIKVNREYIEGVKVAL